MQLNDDEQLTLLGETVLTIDPTLIITWDSLVQLSIDGPDARTAYAALTQKAEEDQSSQSSDAPTAEFPRVHSASTEPPAITQQIPVLRDRHWAIRQIRYQQSSALRND